MRRFLWKWELWLCVAGLPAESRQKINTFNHAGELFCQSHWLRWLQLSLKTMKNFAELPQAPSASFAGTLMNSDLLNGSLNPLLHRSWQSGAAAAAAAAGPKPAAVTRQHPGRNAQRPTPTLTAAERLSPVTYATFHPSWEGWRLQKTQTSALWCWWMHRHGVCWFLHPSIQSSRCVFKSLDTGWNVSSQCCFHQELSRSQDIFCWMEINHVKNDFSFLWKTFAF